MYKVSGIQYNSLYKVIGKHPDGRLFAVRHGNVNGLYVVDRDLNLVTTLNTTLLNRDENGLGNGINECVVLSTGTMICWGIYRTGLNQTKIWRSIDNTYSVFEEVFSLPNDITFIEKSVAVSHDDTLMCCEYTTNEQVEGVWSAPEQLNVWRGSNDGRDWSIVHTRNRVGEDIIRHFHAVRYDKYEDLFWITTGDWYGEPSISTIKPDGTGYTRILQANPVTSGQQVRTTSLMFTEDYIWYGSDSFYNQEHYMARIDRATLQLELLSYLPNDCIRLSDKLSLPKGDLLIANKSYEKSPTNGGITELLVCDNFVTGEWYSLYSWDVASLDTVSVFYQIVNNGDGRIYVYCRRIKDDTNTIKTYITAIMDIEYEDISIGTTTISIDGLLIDIPIYDPITAPSDYDTRLRFMTDDGIRCLKLDGSIPNNIPSIKIKVDDEIKMIVGTIRE